jgi:hypothetical protein
VKESPGARPVIAFWRIGDICFYDRADEAPAAPIRMIRAGH